MVSANEDMSVNDLYMILLNLIILINKNPIYQSSWYFYACYFKSTEISDNILSSEAYVYDI